MTMIRRSHPEAEPGIALTQLELELLDRLVGERRSTSAPPHDLSSYLVKVARLGGYLDRANDPPPGMIVMWRGLARLTDLAIGYSIGTERCG
jgi:hypothetical protein